MPSDTQHEPDVALFDHLRLTAAISAALWAYHAEVDGRVTLEGLQREAEEKFLLVLGDLGGIQQHIYRIQHAQTGTGGIAKRLRARSLEVALATESMAFNLLERAGVPPLNRVMSAGGKFYLLLPNTPKARAALEEARADWEAWALGEGATLVPHLAAYAFSPAGFRDFPKVLHGAHAALAKAKARPFATQLHDPYPFGEYALRPCAACGVRPAVRDEAGALCRGCQRDQEVGKRLPRETVIALFAERADYAFPGAPVALGEGGGYRLRARPDYTPSAAAFEVRPLLGHLPTVRDAQRALPGEDYAAWLEAQGLAGEEDDPDEGLTPDPQRPLTFGELARISEGAPYLGVLMLDADRMGEVFSRGFAWAEKDYASPSRIASLSRTLEQFFTVEVPNLIRHPERYAQRLGWGARAAWKQRRYPLIYSVYAGGDDVFLLGPWDAVLEFALDLERLYRLYTQNPAFTLSGGFVLVRPKTPVPHLAEAAQAAEKAAKHAGRDRLSVFGHPVRWAALSPLAERAEALARRFQDGLPRGLAYRLLDLWRLWRRWEEAQDPEGLRYKPQLHYLFRREELARQRPFLEPLFDHRSLEMRHLPVWVQWATYRTRGE